MYKIVYLILLTIFLFSEERGGASFPSQVLHHGEIASLAWSPNGELALQGAEGIWIYNAELDSYKFIEQISTSRDTVIGEILSVGVSWNEAGNIIAAPYFHNLPSETTGMRVKLWDVTEPIAEEIGFWPLALGHRKIIDVKWNSDNRIAYVYQEQAFDECSCYYVMIATIDHYLQKANYPTLSLEGDSIAINDIEWGQDDKTLAVGKADGVINIWDITERTPLMSLQASASVTDMAWNLQDNILVSAYDNGSIQIWYINEEATFYSLNDENDRIIVTTLDWSPDGTFLAGGDTSGIIHIWNVVTKESIANLVEHEGLVNALAWSPDGTHIASASQDDTVRIWDVSNLTASQ